MSQPKIKLSRRTLFAGAGTVGAVAAARAMLPRAVPELTAPVSQPLPAPERGGGYRLSEHVKRYYRTTFL